MEAILTTHSLSVGYRNGSTATTLLKNLDLSLGQSRLTALLGRNGAGKSTLLRALSRYDKPLAGTISVNGRNADDYSSGEWARTMAIVTTERVNAGALTVSEMVALGRQPHTGLLGTLSRDDRDIVARAIADVGLADKAARFISSLSDGERQKAMIARAIAQQTPIILLDEPTAFLDVASRIDTLRLLRHITSDMGKTVLLSSHDVSQTLLMADDLWVIDSNNNLHAGSTSALIDNGTLDTVFASSDIRFNNARLDYEPA